MDHSLYQEEVPDVKFSYRGSKMKTPHIVPLSDQALKLIKSIKEFTGNRIFAFTSDHYPKKPMSENTINHALQTMGYNTKKMFVLMDSVRWPVVHLLSQGNGVGMPLNDR